MAVVLILICQTSAHHQFYNLCVDFCVIKLIFVLSLNSFVCVYCDIPQKVIFLFLDTSVRVQIISFLRHNFTHNVTVHTFYIKIGFRHISQFIVSNHRYQQFLFTHQRNEAQSSFTQFSCGVVHAIELCEKADKPALICRAHSRDGAYFF